MTGTSFENQETGAFDANLDDEGKWNPDKCYWYTEAALGSAGVSNYVGSAYDYEAKGTVRNALFSKEPMSSKGTPGENKKYLSLDLDLPLERHVMPVYPDTSVMVKTAKYDGIYADTLVKFSPSMTAPIVDEADKIVVWLKETEVRGGSVTNLMVTAGRYAGDFDHVESVDYTIASPVVAADTWCRLTIRAISDVTGVQRMTGNIVRKKAPGFTVYIDGQAVRADGTYTVGEVDHTDWFTPEARVLMSERRLFPWIAKAGVNKALAISKFSFSGQGAIDDVLFTTKRPGHVVADNVFTLKWDAGTLRFDYIVSNATSVVTNRNYDAAVLPRYVDIALGTNNYAQVTVTNVVLDAVHDYSNGVWTAQNDCTVAGNVFTYDGENANPIGFMASSRNVLGVGAGGYETFYEAKKRAREQHVQTIMLMTNVVVGTRVAGAEYYDNGYFAVGADDHIILDLNGHTLQGQSPDAATVTQSGGWLRITDSSDEKTGRIIPSAQSRGQTKVAVKSSASSSSIPEIVMDAGTYDGAVVISGRTALGGVTYWAKCIVEGGSYTNYNGDARQFYLEQYVTNTTLYFALADGYWTSTANGLIWCGEGEDDRWDNPDNWRGHIVPGAGDLAIFPALVGGEEGWNVDFGEGVACKRLWMDGDIAMAGTNEFSDVKVVSGNGRFVGSGMMTFTGTLPGKMTAAAGSGLARLGPAWTGTVRISKITTPKILADIMGWGVAGSKVEFAGVRGYLSDKANYAMPYELVLTDAGTTPAWKNDTGYTGSVVSFPRLTGSGTFESPKNLREVLQVFQFKDVKSFTGKFKLGGKRLLLGTGLIASGAAAGHYTFSDNVGVRSGLGWDGVSAHFGAGLDVYGNVGDELMAYSGVAPVVTGVLVNLYDPVTGETTGTCRLQATGGKIVLTTDALINISGLSVNAETVGGAVKSGATLNIPDGSAVTISGNNVIVNGKIVSTVASYYKVEPVAGSTTSYSVQFDETEATPALADFALSEGNGKAVLQVQNAKPGLWYGVKAISSLAESWDTAPVIAWTQATGGTVTLEAETTGTGKFFRVIMTDKDPKGGAQ